MAKERVTGAKQVSGSSGPVGDIAHLGYSSKDMAAPPAGQAGAAAPKKLDQGVPFGCAPTEHGSSGGGTGAKSSGHGGRIPATGSTCPPQPKEKHHQRDL